MFVNRMGVIQDATLSIPRLRESLAIQMSMPIEESRKRMLSTVDHHRKLLMDEPIPRTESSGPCCSPGMPNGESAFGRRSMGGIGSGETDAPAWPALLEERLAEA